MQRVNKVISKTNNKKRPTEPPTIYHLYLHQFLCLHISFTGSGIGYGGTGSGGYVGTNGGIDYVLSDISGQNITPRGLWVKS